MIVVVFSAGVVEELFYRGYAIERLQRMGLNRYLAGGLPLLVLGLAHGANGWANIVLALSLGFVLTAVYLWRRDLLANMIGHFLIDFASIVLPAPALRSLIPRKLPGRDRQQRRLLQGFTVSYGPLGLPTSKRTNVPTSAPAIAQTKPSSKAMMISNGQRLWAVGSRAQSKITRAKTADGTADAIVSVAFQTFSRIRAKN